MEHHILGDVPYGTSHTSIRQSHAPKCVVALTKVNSKPIIETILSLQRFKESSGIRTDPLVSYSP